MDRFYGNPNVNENNEIVWVSANDSDGHLGHDFKFCLSTEKDPLTEICFAVCNPANFHRLHSKGDGHHRVNIGKHRVIVPKDCICCLCSLTKVLSDSL